MRRAALALVALGVVVLAFLAGARLFHAGPLGPIPDDLKRRLDVDPRVRVALGGRLYEQVAVPVADDAALVELMAPVLRRQFAIEIGGAVRRIPAATRAPLWVYRLDDPSP